MRPIVATHCDADNKKAEKVCATIEGKFFQSDNYKDFCSYSDIIILTGGLEPTKDDITKTALTEFFEDILENNEEVETACRCGDR